MEEYNEILVREEFFNIFNKDKVDVLIDSLVTQTQKKFNANLDQDEVAGLMLDLKAIHHLRGLFTNWINDLEDYVETEEKEKDNE